MGRPRKPPELVKATRRRPGVMADGRRATVVQLVPAAVPAEPPEPPDGLGEHGRADWARVWTAAYWLRPDQDYHWVEMIARAADDLAVFRARVAADGLVARGSMGQPVAHPLIAEIRRCEHVVRRCLSALGMSPTDRARLGLAEVKAQTGLAALQARTARNRDR